MAAAAAAVAHGGAGAEKASSPRPAGDAKEPSAPWTELQWKLVEEFECELTVELPMPDFTIGDLLKLREGSVIAARLRVGRDVPLRLNGTLIGWIEFELVGQRLAVRLTELA
jgi:flagellar motor switch/type III secretory pathway protein FliN